MSNFRFSPNPNQAHRIHWTPWDQAAFAKAQAENKPVLLSVSAVWCYWCHVMDEASYSDPEVAHYINQHFVALRVDNDHRPDINARYNVGGWPTTAFLTGHGGIIGGATYLPPEQLLAMLQEVQRAYQERKPQLYDQARALLQQRREQVVRVAASHPVDGSLVDRIACNVAGTYDPLNGGFGGEPKFPNAPALQFLVHLVRTTGEEFYRVMLDKTLDRMAEGEIFDREEGGFFRHCTKADWSVAQHEKLLEDNLALARVYLEASLLLAKEISTLDRFSGGRFLFGIGAGWLREETEIMGGDFNHRWTQVRESVLVMKELWTKPEAEFHGRYYDFPPVKSYPKPVQKPHPPVILGGMARNVLRRVAAWGDGWMPNRVTPAQVEKSRAVLDTLAAEAGRDPAALTISVYGQPADRRLINSLLNAGANRVVVRPDQCNTEEEMGVELERMAEAVLR